MSRFGRNRRVWLPIVVCFAAAWAAWPGRATAIRAQQPSERPNVLVILVDDLGWGDLRCMGAEDLQTPNIDGLAEDGMRWVNFYANCPVCSPTRSSILSGRYPDAVGVPGVIRTHSRDSWGYLSPQAVLLPAVLNEADYDTGMVGKWHLGLDEPNLPNLRGFRTFYGYLGDMMDDYYTHRRWGINYMARNREIVDPKGHATDIFSDWACEFLEADHGDRPFFLYLAYNAPHVPIQPPQAYLDAYLKRHPNADETRAKIAALIEHLDAGIGRVLAKLDELGMRDDTLVIFTSDNGGQLNVGANNGPWRDGKGTGYEGGIRVPMIARWPGHIPSGTVSEAIGLTMDVFPTVCAAAGVEPPQPVHGVNLLPVLTDEKKTLPARDLFWVRLERRPRTDHGWWLWVARRGDWKIIRGPGDRPDQLFNLKDDPYETKDLADTMPEQLAAMQRLLDCHIADTASVPWRDCRGLGPGELPPEVEEK
ncbi:MAG: N-acetylgalactosamine 6-sulfate sulfatase [Planctomycetota bacterium]|nr:MAG: N-acetylgalactosamine 6-sulfate sulfatase [Planctomycetota bacterium]